MPKISVIIPVYGVEQYIEKCARSLFEQTLDDIEYLFVDDCTPDSSIEILRQVLKEYPKSFIYTKEQAFSLIQSHIKDFTEEEFDIAYSSYQANNKPEIFVYVKKQFFIFDRRLRNIKELFFSENREYYIEYKNEDNLSYLFYSHMSALLQNKSSR